MKIGYQTVIWGGRIDDLELVLCQLAALGYEGIEFAQAPSQLFVRDGEKRRRIRDIHELLRMVKNAGLELLGFAGGALEERTAFCQDYRPPYLYMDSWEGADEALRKVPPFTLAIHPHVFMPIHNMDHVEELLNGNENIDYRRHVKFIPDTAHLTIVEEDPVQAIRQHKDRLAAVHFKDWLPHFGRYSHRYARGFVPLGQGVVPWDRQTRPGRQEETAGVLDVLREIGYDGWIIGELDNSPSEPIHCAFACAEWLSKKGLMRSPDRAKLEGCQRSRRPTQPSAICPPEMELSFLQVLMGASGKGIQAFYSSITEAFSRVVPAQLVKLWIFSPENSRLYLLSAKGLPDVAQHTVLKSLDRCVGSVVREMRPRDFDLTEGGNADTFEDKVLLAALNPKRMVSIPILNPANTHHLRYVVNVFPRDPSTPIDLDIMSHLGEHVALFADGVLDELCTAAAGMTSYHCSQSLTKSELMAKLRWHLLHTFDCEGAQIFLVNDGRNRLEEACSGITEWTVPADQRFYRKGEGLTGKAWQERDMLLAAEAQNDPRASTASCEKDLSPDRRECVLATMAKRRDEVLGVIRLTNKRRDPGSRCSTMFNEDDAAILDSIIQTAIPRLELLQANERQLKTLGRMTHEFQGPIAAIQGSVQLMQDSIDQNRWSAKQMFGQDYLCDILNWTNLLTAEVDGANIFRRSHEGIVPKVSRTLLLKEVIAPAIYQLHFPLMERGLSLERIRHGRFDIPLLWIDRDQFRQVIFNMLSNAIKYSQDKHTFRVDIESGKISGYYVIWFSDYGIGVNPELKEAIFEPGFRAPEAVAKDVGGQGLGLSVVRAVIEAHGGRIQLTGFKKPTRFTVRLPDSLDRTPP